MIVFFCKARSCEAMTIRASPQTESFSGPYFWDQRTL